MALSNAERQQRWRANNTDTYYERRTAYRHDNSKWETDASYLARPFVAWDGEGITTSDGRHRYIMLAVKGGGVSADIAEPTGLTTVQCFEFLLANTRPDTVNVIYGGSYDFNMWCRDLPRSVLERLYRFPTARWNGYQLAWRPGKSFTVKRLADKRTAIIYDVVSFFQCGFVKACDDYLGDRFHERQLIVDNKALRSSFALADVPTVRRYNDAELVNLAVLMTDLRERLNKVGLRPRRWDGPGAIAASLLAREGVKDHMAESPPKVAQAARYAYAGGRFEPVRFGHVDGLAYEYDRNSAYPYALTFVPSLADGSWEHEYGDPGSEPFALYHIEYHGNDPTLPGALFRRDPNGTICYPLHVTGWYWSPEYEACKAYCEAGYGSMRVLDAHVFHPAIPAHAAPFAWVEPMYNKRRALKQAGDGAHVGLKLGLNSTYGKLAQQVGARITPEGIRKPPFHQIEWAGYVTSHCRAAMLTACLPKIGAVIAFETDAVFTSEPLDLPLSSNLGDFEVTEFASLTYCQSGVYFGTLTDGKPVAKTRGVDLGSLRLDDVLQGMTYRRATDRIATAQLTRFTGLGVALSQDFGKWRTWITQPKRLTLEPSGKRIHFDCPACTSDFGITYGAWHTTMCPMMNAAHSREFPVAWINPNPEMDELEEMRRVPLDYD